MTDRSPSRVCLGVIVGAHGVRGDVRVKAFTEDPANLSAYGPLTDETGARSFTVLTAKPLKGDVLAVRLKEVTNRDAALALKGCELFIDRADLPPAEEDEFYFEDLVGLAAMHVDGRPLGEVRAVFDYGAGPLIELWRVPGVKGPHLIPFTKAAVPKVDLAARQILIDPPPGLLDEGSKTPA